MTYNELEIAGETADNYIFFFSSSNEGKLLLHSHPVDVIELRQQRAHLQYTVS